MKEKVLQSWTNPWALAIASGILLGLSYSPVNLSILQIPAFLMLFRLSDISPTRSYFAGKAFISFVIWNFTTTYWLMFADVLAGVAAILANAALMLIPMLIIRALLRKDIHVLFLSILISSTWVCYEYLHHHWDLAWPWLALGNGWAVHTGVIQYISFTGHLAISFWIIATSLLLYKTILSTRKDVFYYTVTVFLIFPLLSVFSLITFSEEPEGSLEVAIIQPNLDSYQTYGGFNSVDELTEMLLEISDSVRTENTDLIIWPENAIDTAIGRESAFRFRVSDTLRNWNADLITGAVFIDTYEDREEPAIVRGQHSGSGFNIYNAALHFTPDNELDVYRKGNLVPIVERMPYAETLQKIDRFGWVNWGLVTGYGKGIQANNFRIGNHETPALICYDSVFTSWVGEFVRNGAGFLTIVTNDGWWGETSGHKQHFAYARLRAIEYRQWIARSANNGISGIISPDGVVHVETDYWVRTGFTHDIYPTGKVTLFARYGNWFNWLMVVGTIMAVAVLYIKKEDP